MAGFRSNINRSIEAYARWAFRHPWPIVIAVAAVFFALTFRLPSLSIDASNEGLLPESDPVRQSYEEFKTDFGSDELIIVAVESSRQSPLEFLKTLQALHQQLADKTPHAVEITSLINVPALRYRGDLPVIEKRLQPFPRTEAQCKELWSGLVKDPHYVNRLISADGRLAAIIIRTAAASGARLQSGKQPISVIQQKIQQEAIEAIKAVTGDFDSKNYRIYLSGSPVVVAAVNRIGVKEMKLFLGISSLIIGFILFLLFGRVSGVLLPPLVVGLATASALGLMAHAGVTFTAPTIMLPSFLLAVGVGDCVHILTLFFQRFDQNGDKEEAIVYALNHCGLAIVMTTLTTAAGLGSFAAAQVTPIAHIGIFGSAGVLAAFVYTVLLLPPLLRLLPLKIRAMRSQPSAPGISDRFLDWAAKTSVQRARWIVATGIILAVVTTIGVFKIRFVHHPIKWLPPNRPERVAAEKIDRRLNGSVVLEVIVDTQRPYGILEPAVVKKLDHLSTDIMNMREGELRAGKIYSIADLVKSVHRALNDNQPEFYTLPETQLLIPLGLSILAGAGPDNFRSNGFRNVADSHFKKARFTIQAPWENALVYARFIRQVENRFQNAFGENAAVTVTGQMSLFARTITSAMRATARSYLIAAVVITGLMFLMLGGRLIGWLSLIPNLTPILMMMGLIGWFHVRLDLFSLTMGSIAVGLVVDDTIHFMNAFRDYYAGTGSVTGAIRHTFHTTGRALIVTTLVISSAAFVFVFSELRAMGVFGSLIGLTLLAALAADLFFLPALLSLTLGRSKNPGFKTRY
jgi:predicted RND superfamily exporter protein